SVTILTLAWCWPGLLWLGAGLRNRAAAGYALVTGRMRNPSPQSPLFAAGLVLALTCVGGLIALPRTLHGERNGYRLAGEWLRGRMPVEYNLVDPEGLVSLYADLADCNLWEKDHPALSAAHLDTLLSKWTDV